MLTITRLFGWLLVVVLFTSLPASPAEAQQLQPPRNWSPTDLNPNYALRKQQLTSPPAGPGTQQRGPGHAPLARPACFEPFDTTAGGGWQRVPRDDDNSFGPVELGWNFSLFGSTYHQVYVNTNGNITFASPLPSYDPAGFPIDTPMVAAFWADVDTRAAGSGSVWFKVFSDRLVVVWNKVGYFNLQANRKNTFQLTIRANTAPGFQGNDVIIAYDDMQWTTGEASMGNNGFGGFPATVGANRGNGIDYIQTGRFNLDGSTPPNRPVAGSPGGVDWLDGQCLGYQVGAVGNVPPAVAGLPDGNTLVVNQGETRSVMLQFSGPEPSQTVSVVSSLNGLCNASASTSNNGSPNPTTTFAVTGSLCNVGTSTVTFTATDNAQPTPAQSVFTITVQVNPPPPDGSWTGAVSTDWNTPGNWTNNVLPTDGIDVIIPAGVPRMPILSGSGAANALTVATGATLTITGPGVLKLNGNLTNNGSLGGAGTLRTAGPAPQSAGGSNGLRLGTVTVGTAGLLLNTPLAVEQLLTLDGNLTSNGRLTLLSSVSGTAMVINNGAAEVLGTATVQRYLDVSRNAGAGYRQLAAPVRNTTLADLTTGGFAPTVNANYNTAATPGAVTPFPNIFAYDQSRVTTTGGGARADFDRGWVSPASPADAMTPGRGYTVNIVAGQTVDFVGILGNGSVPLTGLTRTSQSESGWHLLGNPYPSPILWRQAHRSATGLDSTVFVFKSSGQYAGSYASFVNGVGTNGGSNVIPVGQAFFVRTAAPGTSASLALSNAARPSAYTDLAVQRTAPDLRPLLQLGLSGGGVTDQVAVYFQAGATAGFDQGFDAPKLAAGNSVLLALDAASGPLSISGLPPLGSAAVSVPLLVRVARAGTYTLRADELLHLPAGTTLHLRDALTGALTPLAPQATYTFTADATLTAPRFELVFNAARVTAAAPGALAAQVSVYPNPAHQQLRLGLPADQRPAEVVLSNALGQAVRQWVLPAGRGAAPQVLALGELPRGIYTLRVALATGTVTRRIVVE